jgi:hypothetical protein
MANFNPLANFKIGTTEVPLSYWEIKNHAEMRAWVMAKIPHLIYNEQFLEIITEMEMTRFLELKMNRTKIAEQSKAKIEEIKDELYSA